MAKLPQVSLIETTDLQTFHLVRMHENVDCRGFMNVTNAWNHYANKTRPQDFLQQFLPHLNDKVNQDYHIQYQKLIKALFTQVNIQNVQAEMKKLAALPERHVNSTSGEKAAEWIRSELERMSAARAQEDIEIFTVPTINHAKQPSVVLKIGKNAEPGILIGTHIDTLQMQLLHRLGIAEDGSGIVTMLETARLLINSSYTFKRPIYLVWYSGQDEGGLGAQSVVQAFNREHRSIETVLQLANTSFVGEFEPSIGLGDELTDAGLTTFVADLVMTYLRLPVGVVSCGFACSGQLVWQKNGTRVISPYTSMHDTELSRVGTHSQMKGVSFMHMLDFIKLSLAFAIELAEPV